MAGFNTSTGEPYTPEDCLKTLDTLYKMGHLTLGEMQSLRHYVEFHAGSDYPKDLITK